MWEFLFSAILRFLGYELEKKIGTIENSHKQQMAADSSNLTRGELEKDIEKGEL